MSIPTPFNPLGTLGANPLHGYVTNGLILCFDALLEETGTRNYLTNWASGTQCEFDNPLLVTGGYIAGATESKAIFNKDPLQQIDGYPPVGMDYSADICAQQSSYMDFTVWSDAPNDMHLGFQWHHSEDGIRVRGALGKDRISPILSYPLQSGEKNSAHLEFDTVCSLKINGEPVGSIVNNNAGVGLHTIGIGSVSYIAARANKVRLFAYRLYNRRLSIAEQKQNYAMDKKRFGLQ